MRKYRIFVELAEPLLGHSRLTWTHEFDGSHKAETYLAERLSIMAGNGYEVIDSGWYPLDEKPVQLELFS